MLNHKYGSYNITYKKKHINNLIAYYLRELYYNFILRELIKNFIENTEKFHIVVNLNNIQILGIKGHNDLNYEDVVS